MLHSGECQLEGIAKAKAADAVIFVGGISARLEGEEMGRDNAFAGFEGGEGLRSVAGRIPVIGRATGSEKKQRREAERSPYRHQ